MSRLAAKDFPPELLELYDYYVHGRITRRDFLDRAGQFVGSVAAVSMLAFTTTRRRATTSRRPSWPGRGRSTGFAAISPEGCGVFLN